MYSRIKEALFLEDDGEVYPVGDRGFIIIANINWYPSSKKCIDQSLKITNHIRRLVKDEMDVVMGISNPFKELKRFKNIC